jgi:hypothetical protein
MPAISRRRARASRDITVPIGALHVAQHQRFPERHRELRYGSFEQARIGLGNQRRLRRPASLDRRSAAQLVALRFLEIVDHNQCRRSVLAQPRESRVARDGQQPGAGIAAGKSADAAKGAQACLLDDILGVGGVAGKPARKRVGVGEVRHHHRAEARLIVVCYHAPTLSTDRQTGGFIPGWRATFVRSASL